MNTVRRCDPRKLPLEPSILRRFAIRSALLCYSLIALFGQGLHEWIDHDDHEPAACFVWVSPSLGSQVFPADHDGCQHNADHCAICQHHSLGQIFVAAPAAEILLAVYEFLSPPAPECVVCPAHFSPAQPRAPPAFA